VACRALTRREEAIAQVAEISRRYASFGGYISAAASHASAGGALAITERQAGLSRTNTKNYTSLSAIHKDMIARLHDYREATLDAIEAVVAWMTVTGRRDFRWRGSLFFISCLHDLYRAAFRNQAVQYLLRLHTAYNPLAMPSARWSIIPLGDLPKHNSPHTRLNAPGVGTLHTLSTDGAIQRMSQLLEDDVSSSLARCDHAIATLRRYLGSQVLVCVQAIVRRRHLRRRFLIARVAMMRLQRIGRGFLRTRRPLGVFRATRAAAVIHRVANGALVRSRLRGLRALAITAQRLVRGFLCRCRLWYRMDAATRIQRMVRSVIARRNGRQTRRMMRSVLLQRVGRGYALRRRLCGFGAKQRSALQDTVLGLGNQERASRTTLQAEAIAAAAEQLYRSLAARSRLEMTERAMEWLVAAEGLARRAWCCTRRIARCAVCVVTRD
jgi:hypothetical protein